MPKVFYTICRAPGAVLIALAMMLGWPAQSSAQMGLRDADVPFVTSRNLTGAQKPQEYFGDERSSLSAGICHVRPLDLEGLSAVVNVAPSFLREELLRVQDVTLAKPATLLDSLSDTPSGQAPALYVHGYFISFDKGCRRAALLQQNAALDGRMLWFSWPSDGSLASYIHDEADLYWSVPDIAETILELERRHGGAAVDVIGHSLGARGVVLALYDIASMRPDMRLGDVVLLAPDMDFAIFERLLPRIRPIARRITVYVTSGDRPLAVSAQLHGYPRLGEAGNPVDRLAGVEVVDLSALPANTPSGHIYHIHSPEVGGDLNQLLGQGLPAAKRRNLFQTGPNTWRLRPDPE
jgi:esterase/lipase superfamily enzyme